MSAARVPGAVRRMLARADRFLLLLIATVALAAVLPARGVAATWVDHGTTVAVALLFLLYGARLSPQAIWAGLAHWRLQLLVFASTFALFPLIGVGVAAATRAWLPAPIVTGLLFLCLLPSTVQSSIAFTSIARGNVPAALCSASLSNLVGVVVTPLLVAQLLSGASGGLSLDAVRDIAVQILLPFVAGQAVRPWVQGWLLAHPLLTKVVDRGSVLVVVYAAFGAGVVAGLWAHVSPVTLVAIVAVSLLILALVLAATTLAARAIGFGVADEIATVFCGSKKSMASGIPMAAILFPAHSVGLIVLPLMIFHQLQLFVCAWLARRYAGDPRHAVAPEGLAAGARDRQEPAA